jgi:hypothetical protein
MGTDVSTPKGQRTAISVGNVEFHKGVSRMSHKSDGNYSESRKSVVCVVWKR